jgi:hypothetical protein
MAGEPVTSGTNINPEAEVNRGPDSQSVDGFSSNTDHPGVSLAKALQSSPRRRRVNSVSRDGATEAGVVKADRELPKPEPNDHKNPFKQSDNILQTIADHFVEARKLQKAEAWRQLQVDLMHASPFICPGVIPYKDLISIVSEIEKEIKGGTSQAGKSNEEIMADFLSGQGSLVVAQADLAPDLARDKSLDTSAIISVGEGEDGPVKDIPLSNGPSITPSSPSPD